MNKFFIRITGILILANGFGFQALSQQTVSLAGQWQVRLDSLDAGEREKWFLQDFPQTIQLPGTLDDARLGTPSRLEPVISPAVLLQLNRNHSYLGAAWYRKQIEIPASWGNKQLSLLLERVIWQTDLWIDGHYIGNQASLSAPHEYQNLGRWLKPGKHAVTLRVDNRRKYDVDLRRDNSRGGRNWPHAYTNATQIIWNGVIGRMELRATDNLFIDNLQVYPQPGSKQIRVIAVIKNHTGRNLDAQLTLEIGGINQPFNGIVRKKIKKGTITDTIEAYLRNIDLKLWDEFNPNMYQLTATLSSGENKAGDQRKVSFGVRKLDNQKSLLQVNSRRVFLRGTLESVIFPLTGHPPMEQAGWRKVFETARAYGLNHLRFHSWCPPNAAFEVADELGFYLQIELPLWSHHVGRDKVLSDYLEDEAARIIRNYGNHPSFCFWSIGNELEGDFKYMNSLVAKLKKLDNRHLYATTTFSFQKEHGRWPEPEDEFYVTQYTTKGWVRGQGIFNTYPPDFTADYLKAIEGLPVPIITHEIGQYSVFPNIDEIKKYTGVLKPLNFMAIRGELEKKNMLDLAPSFTLASGKLAANLYKEEIERALKTKGMSGFQLLDLHDFPGQGTALVGVLDAFWDSKGLVSPEEHRMYNGAVVPLIRFKKAVYTNTEKFEATAEIANFSGMEIKDITPEWLVADNKGRTWFKGELAKKNIAVGNGIELGSFSFNLNDIKEARQLTIELKLKGTNYRNSWRIWVYPEKVTQANKEIVFTTSLNDALKHLKAGKKVLLNPDTASIKGVKGIFTPVFWSPVHFPNQPGTMGILCDPKHQALAHFPTEAHSDWQWWDLITSSKTMIIDSLPQLKPVVRVIDNFVKNRKMANVIEAKVGRGSLMVVSADITNKLEERPAARQLRYSLEQYMQGKYFAPVVNLREEQLEFLLMKQ